MTLLSSASQLRTLVFNESTGSPLPLFTSMDNITDSDGQTLLWLSVEISPMIDAMDMLSGNALNTGLSLEVTTTDTGNILLNVSGEANHSIYEQVLQTITFVNDFPGINATQRQIWVVTYDGITESPAHNIYITIDLFDDDPVCFFNTMVSNLTSHEKNYHFHCYLLHTCASCMTYLCQLHDILAPVLF